MLSTTQSALLVLFGTILILITLSACAKNTGSGEALQRSNTTFCRIVEALRPVPIYPNDVEAEKRHKTEWFAAIECSCNNNCPPKEKQNGS